MSGPTEIEVVNTGEVLAVAISSAIVVEGVQIPPSDGGAQRLDELDDVEGADLGLGGQVLTKSLDGIWRPAAPTGGGGASGLVFLQATPAATWMIPHNLGGYPQVTAVDVDGFRVWPDLVYGSENAVTLTHAEPMAGSAYLI